MVGLGFNVASVTIEVSCNDNDDVGFNDGGSGEFKPIRVNLHRTAASPIKRADVPL